MTSDRGPHSPHSGLAQRSQTRSPGLLVTGSSLPRPDRPEPQSRHNNTINHPSVCHGPLNSSRGQGSKRWPFQNRPCTPLPVDLGP